MNHNYLITVSSERKHIGSYYSEALTEIASLKAVNKGCEISVYDMNNMRYLGKEEILTMAAMATKLPEGEPKPIEEKKPVPKSRRKASKMWERPVRCVETRQVFKSIRICSEKLGIAYKAIWNAINSGRPRKGLHFVNVKRKVKH